MAAAVGLALSACSASGTNYRDAAVKLIEGDLERDLGRGELTASCDEPASKPAVGDTFACWASTDGGERIAFLATVQEGSKVFVESLDPYQQVAVELIEGELSAQSGLGQLRATCERPRAGAGPGDTFDCLGRTPDRRDVVFVATVGEGGTVDVSSTNLVTPEGLDRIEQVATDALEAELGVSLGGGGVDCGDGATLLDPRTESLRCTLVDPDTGDVYDAEVTIDDLADLSTLSVSVAEEPR